MKNYSSIKATKSHQTSSSHNRNIAAVLIVFVLLCGVLWVWPELPGKAAEIVFQPILKGETELRTRLQGNNNNSDLSISEQEELLYLRSENEELRALLSDKADDGIAAAVIGRPSTLPYDVLIIDKGSDDGVLEKAPVYASENQVIGTIAKVYSDSALVALVSTPDWSSTVYIYGPNIYTTIVGQGGGIARVHVPQGVPLEEGNIAAVPALGSGIYGTISLVDSVPSRPEQYGYISMETPINSLRFVRVGKEPLAELSFEEAKVIVDETRRNLLAVPVPEGILIDVDSSTSTESVSTSTTATTSSAL